MAGAAPAYRYSYPERETVRAPRIQVIPGSGKKDRTTYLAPGLVTFAKFLAVAFVVFAFFGFARIWLSSATVTTALSSEEVSAKIETARSFGSELEVREGYLSNPTYLRVEAVKLSMGASHAQASIVLPEDIIKTDEAGNLSLSQSIKAANGC